MIVRGLGTQERLVDELKSHIQAFTFRIVDQPDMFSRFVRQIGNVFRTNNLNLAADTNCSHERFGHIESQCCVFYRTFCATMAPALYSGFGLPAVRDSREMPMAEGPWQHARLWLLPTQTTGPRFDDVYHQKRLRCIMHESRST